MNVALTLFALVWNVVAASDFPLKCPGLVSSATAVLWKEKLPHLPYNQRLAATSEGSVLVFGDGAEFRVGEVLWGERDKTQGKAFRLNSKQAIWIPFFLQEPASLEVYEAEQRLFLTNAIDFSKVWRELLENGVPVLAVLETGYRAQYFVIEAPPEDSIWIREFLNQNSPGRPKDFHFLMMMEEALITFAKQTAMFTEIGEEDFLRNGFFHPSRGWFLREWSSYNTMYRPVSRGYGPIRAASIFSGLMKQDVALSTKEYAAKIALAAVGRYRPSRTGPMLNTDAHRLFSRLDQAVMEERRRLFGKKNEVISRFIY